MDTGWEIIGFDLQVLMPEGPL